MKRSRRDSSSPGIKILILLMFVVLGLFLPAWALGRPASLEHDGSPDYAWSISDQLVQHGSDGDPVGGERFDDETRMLFEYREETNESIPGYGGSHGQPGYENLYRLIGLIRNPFLGLVGVGSIPTVVSP